MGINVLITDKSSGVTGVSHIVNTWEEIIYCRLVGAEGERGPGAGERGASTRARCETGNPRQRARAPAPPAAARSRLALVPLEIVFTVLFSHPPTTP